MSNQYVQRLRVILNSLYAAQEALSYIERHWHNQNIYQEIDLLTPRDFVQASRQVEAVYFVRLFAEFKGILKDHIMTNHPRVSVPGKPKVDWLINRVVRAENVTIEMPQRRRLDMIRDYRNSIAHRHAIPVTAIPFDDAVSVLNTFVARLPDPLT